LIPVIKPNDMGSLFAGSVVIGLAFAFAGPFIGVLSIIASFIYGAGVMLNMLSPKDKRKDLTKF
jgi:hypothetical protein